MKLKDYQQGRADGLALARTIVQAGGLAELEKELTLRNITGIQMNGRVTQLEASGAADRVRELVMATVLTMSLEVLMDEFDFGKMRLRRFAERFNEKTDCMGGGFVNWKDMTEDVEQKTGIKINIELAASRGEILLPNTEEDKATKQSKPKKEEKAKTGQKNKEPKREAAKKEKVRR